MGMAPSDMLLELLEIYRKKNVLHLPLVEIFTAAKGSVWRIP
jgi:hypothetical protein